MGPSVLHFLLRPTSWGELGEPTNQLALAIKPDRLAYTAPARVRNLSAAVTAAASALGAAGGIVLFRNPLPLSRWIATVRPYLVDVK